MIETCKTWEKNDNFLGFQLKSQRSASPGRQLVPCVRGLRTFSRDQCPVFNFGSFGSTKSGPSGRAIDGNLGEAMAAMIMAQIGSTRVRVHLLCVCLVDLTWPSCPFSTERDWGHGHSGLPNNCCGWWAGFPRYVAMLLNTIPKRGFIPKIPKYLFVSNSVFDRALLTYPPIGSESVTGLWPLPCQDNALVVYSMDTPEPRKNTQATIVARNHPKSQL